MFLRFPFAIALLWTENNFFVLQCLWNGQNFYLIVHLEMVLEAIFKQLYFCGLLPQCCSRHAVLLNVTTHPETSHIVQRRWFILPSTGFCFLALEFGNNPQGNREVWEPSLNYASWLAPFPVFLPSPGTYSQCNSIVLVRLCPGLCNFLQCNKEKKNSKRLFWKLGFLFNKK